ncbi:A-agglutinin anchorage subunit [Rhodotorula toruloides]|uniref:A-agglutinin anchorage subunit n=1 Tax=Rhodotorula toruloides TaxID=5286 RepID=A0A511K7D4_RHOTO|nr:A-agglutinin anchorage subunit [Rhodotorula toruloides]
MTAPLYQPFIVAPPFTACEQSYLVFGQGTAPYTINVIATGDVNGTSLEQLPLQHEPGVFRWTVDFLPGANITFSLHDAKGQQAYSQFRVVQTGSGATCPKNDYTTKHSSIAGAIAGGVIGGLVAVLLILILLFCLRRRRRQEVNAASLPTSNTLGRRGSKTPSLDPDDRPLTDGPADLMRAGTYNLGSVRFTEQSLEQLREMDRPPTYERARTDRHALTDPPPPPPALEGVVTERRRSSLDDEIAEVVER